MTNKELIRILQGLPQDLPVYIWGVFEDINDPVSTDAEVKSVELTPGKITLTEYPEL